jgi:hypothetical protein
MRPSLLLGLLLPLLLLEADLAGSSLALQDTLLQVCCCSCCQGACCGLSCLQTTTSRVSKPEPRVMYAIELFSAYLWVPEQWVPLGRTTWREACAGAATLQGRQKCQYWRLVDQM